MTAILLGLAIHSLPNLAAAPDENLVGLWKLENQGEGSNQMRFESGGQWKLEIQSGDKTDSSGGTWKTEKLDKAEKGPLITPQFRLHLDGWIRKDTPSYPEGVRVMENSTDGNSVLIRETFMGAVQVDKASGKKTLVLYRFLENRTNAIVPPVISRRYTWVGP